MWRYALALDKPRGEHDDQFSAELILTTGDLMSMGLYVLFYLSSYLDGLAQRMILVVLVLETPIRINRRVNILNKFYSLEIVCSWYRT